MREHNVDLIGGDFNMSAFSTVGDVFSDAEFSAPGNSFLWGLGALEEPSRECAGFLIMPKCPYEWRVHSYGCYKFDNATLDLGPRDLTAHLLFFFISVLPICMGPVSKPNKEDLSADTTNKNVCGDDVHDRAPVHQGHVSVSLFHTFCCSPCREPFASQLCLLSVLTQGRFASCPCPCPCLCLCLCVTPSLLSMHHAPGCKYRPSRNAHSVFSLKPTVAVPCGPAVTSPRPTMTSTKLTTIFFFCPLCSRA